MKLLSQEDYAKYTALNEEIEEHRPDTSWHSTLVAVVIMVVAGFLIYAVASVVDVTNLLDNV